MDSRFWGVKPGGVQKTRILKVEATPPNGEAIVRPCRKNQACAGVAIMFTA